jgi:hypothetical protein
MAEAFILTARDLAAYRRRLRPLSPERITAAVETPVELLFGDPRRPIRPWVELTVRATVSAEADDIKEWRVDSIETWVPNGWGGQWAPVGAHSPWGDERRLFAMIEAACCDENEKFAADALAALRKEAATRRSVANMRSAAE